MSLKDWSNDLSVSVQALDNQHKNLLRLFDCLHGAKQSGKDRAVEGKMLDGVLFFTKSHFSREEQLLYQSGYSGSATHKSHHDNLIQKVEVMHKNYYLGDDDVPQNVAALLNHWLTDHIVTEDKKFASAVNNVKR